MSSKTLSSIFSELSNLDEESFPPVEEWNPPLCENVQMRIEYKEDEPSPYVVVRKNLEALINRNVYYKLIETCEERDESYGVYSSGIFYKLS